MVFVYFVFECVDLFGFVYGQVDIVQIVDQVMFVEMVDFEGDVIIFQIFDFLVFQIDCQGEVGVMFCSM